MKTLLSISLYALFSLTLSAEKVSHTLQTESTPPHVTVSFSLAPQELLLRDFLYFTVNDPQLTVSASESAPAIQQFDRSFQANENVYTGSPEFVVSIGGTTSISRPELTVSYLLSSNKDSKEYRIALPSAQEISNEITPPTLKNEQPPTVTKQNDVHKKPAKSFREKLSTLFQWFTKKTTALFSSVKQTITGAVTTSESSLLRLLLVFLLGIIMSFTPCIYPMIPITMGILQAANSSRVPSLWRNFSLALSYTLGISTTFALLGFFTITFSMRFGELLGNPWFVALLVLFLGYMALSLFGWYELYIPRFLQPRSKTAFPGGAYISAYLFGIVSGSFASPCLSPGLIIVLGLASALGSLWHGLLLLFVFGIGSSLPLLIIGTFSGAIAFLPRAGVWMVEMKKIFGFMLIGMCFYYLQVLVASTILLWSLGVFLLCSGVYYVATVSKKDNRLHRKIVIAMGFFLILGAFFTFLQAFKASYQFCHEKSESIWKTNYEEARHEARTSGKKLFIDFGADWCSLCKVIEKGILSDPLVIKALLKFIPVHIDCTTSANTSCADVAARFVSLGLPTLVVVDPTNEQVLTRWGSELNEKTADEWIKELERLS